MDMPQRYKTNAEYKTVGNLKISRKLEAIGPDNVHIETMVVLEDEVILRGDLGKIQIGRGTIIDTASVIHPCLNSPKPPFEYKYLFIGEHCYIGKNCIIAARTIGNNVWIGENSIISDRAEIGNRVKILPNTYVTPDTKVPDNCVFGGKPGKFLGELTESFDQSISEFCNDFYLNLIVTQKEI